jgi:selenocysteine lyase/cysteine desulfurase
MTRNEVSASQSTSKTMSRFHEVIRREFPRADADANGRPRIFFENAAGSLVLQRAVEAEARARMDYSANVDGPFWESKMNEQIIMEGRKVVSDFLNAPSEDCIISGESATSILFSLSYALSKDMSGKENIVLTDYEHYANVSPWLELERRGAVKEVRFAKFNLQDGQLDVSHLASLIDENTRVVSVAGVSNVLGSKTPTVQVFKLAREKGAYSVLDAVHTVPHIPVDVQRIGCDFLVFSAYKLFGRRGSFAYGKKNLLEGLKPYKVEPAPTKPPGNWEMGTRDQALFASITAVMGYLNWLGSQVESQVRDEITEYAGRRRMLKAALSWIEKYEQTLSNAMLGGTNGVRGMQDIEGIEVYGVKEPSKTRLRVPTFTFNIVGVDAFQVAQYLWDRHSIAVLAENGGGFYSRTLRTYEKSVGVRASLVHFNTVEEVEAFLRALADAVKHFGAA